jgi:hypothetical protein
MHLILVNEDIVLFLQTSPIDSDILETHDLSINQSSRRIIVP